MTVAEITSQRQAARAKMEDLLGRTASREMSTEEKQILADLTAEGQRLGGLLTRYQALDTFDTGAPANLIRTPQKDKPSKEALIASLDQWLRTGKAAVDVPLQIEQSPVSGASAAVPTEVLAQTLDNYPAVDTLASLGANIINRQTTNPLVLPVITDDEDATLRLEGAMSTESTPFDAEDITLTGAMYDSLIKASIPSLMNVAFSVQEKITGVLAARILRKQSKAAMAALKTSVQANHTNCFVPKGADERTTLLSLIASMSQFYSGPDNKFLFNRTDWLNIADARDEENRPLLDVSTGKVLGYNYVISDDVDRVYFGRWRAGITASRTPLNIQRLDEKYVPYIGFWAYQFGDWKFYSDLDATDQPVKFTNLETAGS